MTRIGSLRVGCPTCLVLVLCLAGGGGGAPANAAGVHPELGIAESGFMGLGDFATVSKFGFGGDAALHLVRNRGGLGLRAAGGLQLLQSHRTPTGEVIFNGIGTQPGTFEANTKFLWIAIGPAWSKPFGNSRVDLYLMGGKAIARATSSEAWINTVGSDPGSTSVPLILSGATWSLPRGPVELGAELFASGRAAFWDNPPMVVDGTGNHVLRSRTASITGITIRVGYRFWGAPHKQ